MQTYTPGIEKLIAEELAKRSYSKGHTPVTVVAAGGFKLIFRNFYLALQDFDRGKATPRYELPLAREAILRDHRVDVFRDYLKIVVESVSFPKNPKEESFLKVMAMICASYRLYELSDRADEELASHLIATSG